MSSLGKFLLLVLLVLVSVVIFRAQFMFKSRQPPRPYTIETDNRKIKLLKTREILDRFEGALNIPSVSYKQHQYESKQMLRLIKFIRENYHNLHNSPLTSHELVSNYSLLYIIKGSDAKLRPYMLTSHLDVVPAIENKWSSDPFKMTIKKDGFIYARGTMDAKHLTMAILEAVEVLLSENFKPRRTIILAFGHDEEVLGEEGAQMIARLIKQKFRQYDKLEYILDEGNVISKTRFPGVPHDLALIGVSEKGYLSLNVSSIGQVGHGSMPHSRTAISKLANVVGRFHATSLPSMSGQGVEREMFNILATYADWPMKLVYSNYWLFKPFIDHTFSQHPVLNGLIRTTTAVTMIEGGIKENMLPDHASAIINHRIHEKQTVAEVLDLDLKIINDPTISAKVEFACEPKPISPFCDECFGYKLIERSMSEVYPNTVAVPSVFLATTDSKWYTNLTDSIYRFSAIAVELEEMKNFHGHDERLSVINYERLINFYYHLILKSDDSTLVKSEVREEL